MMGPPAPSWHFCESGTANDAFGAFVFEAWDPQPQTANSTLAVDANGRVDLAKVLGAAINALVAGRIDASVGAMAANVMTAAAAAADLTTELQTGLATSAALATVQADTDDIQARLPAALVAGRMDTSVGAMAANVLTATAIAADAITDAKVASDVTIASVTGAVGSVTGNVGGNVVGSVASVTGNVGGSVGSVIGLTAANLDATISSRAATGAAMSLTVAERAAVVDKLLGRNQQGGADSAPTVSQAFASGLLKIEIAAGVMTVKHGDGTTAFTRTLTRATADAIVSLV